MWQQYTRDTTTANERGFDSIFSDFDHALTAYVVAEIETQVCIILILYNANCNQNENTLIEVRFFLSNMNRLNLCQMKRQKHRFIN